MLHPFPRTVAAFACLCLPFGVVCASEAQVTTLAGSGQQAFADGTGAAARFNEPKGVAISGGTLYVGDTLNHRVRAVDVATRAVTTLAGAASQGYADGTGAAAQFKRPTGVAISGTTLYVVDSYNNRIRAIEVASGAVTTIAGSGEFAYADGTGAAAKFNEPYGLAVSQDGNTLYVADRGNHRLRAVDVATGAVTTLAGAASQGYADGTGAAAQFFQPSNVVVAKDGKTLYVTDRVNHRVRAVNLATSAVTTLAY